MKKLSALLVVLALCFSLVACGAPDVQPAIDAYNTLAANYNEFVDVANEDLSGWATEDIEYFNSIAAVITEYGEKLQSDTAFTQEEIDEMVAKFNECNAAVEEVLALYE